MNGNPRLHLDDNSYIEARMKGKTFDGYIKVNTGTQERRRGKLRNVTRPKIAIVDSFIPNDFQNDHPTEVTAFYRAIEKRKNGG